MPFPLAIAALRKRSPDLIPWAWGINGFMSVVGSLLAVISELKYGFNVTLLVAVAIYLLAVPCFIKITRDCEKVFDSADLQRLEASVQRAE
jgi:hypothetical protein